MQSGFTQTLSMRNFLVMKRVPSDENSSPTTTRRNSGSNSRRNSGSNNANPIGRRSSGSKNITTNKQISGASASDSVQVEQTYHDLLRKSRRNLKMNASSNRNLVDDLGPYSCHEIGRMNQNGGSSTHKPKVHFGEDAIHHLHSSCPIIDEDLPPQRQLDLSAAGKHGLSLSSLPTKSNNPQTLLLRRQNLKDKDSNLVVESIRGDKLATIDGVGEAIILENPDSTPADRRLVQDTDGNIYAVILRTLSGGGKNHYRICGVEKMYEEQRKSRESGLFTHAEVKNSGGIGVQFSMKVRGDGVDEQEATKYVTEFFGPSIFKWGRGRPRGFLIKNTEGRECARITVLGGAKAISVEPQVDVRLMTCFAAIIDEMVEKRMR